MNASQIDLTQCDREPIHIPGSIQPHGAMLIADQTSLVVTHAGNVEALTGRNDWQDKTIRELLGAEAVFEAERIIGGEGRSLPGRIILSMASGACDAQFPAPQLRHQLFAYYVLQSDSATPQVGTRGS